MQRKGKESKISMIKRLFVNFCGYLLLLAVSISGFEIFLRVFIGKSYDFIIDLSVWLTVWALILIAGPLLSEEGHVSIDFIREKLQGKLRLLLELFITLSVLVFGVALCLGSIIYVYQLYDRQVVFPRYFAIPMWVVQLCMPLGMFIFSIYAAILFVQAIKRKW